jgi:hypothetical protein
LLLCFFFVLYINAQAPLKVYSQSRNGAEIINMNGNGISIAYAANLQMDQSYPVTNTEQTIYFTADKGTPNVYTANFLTNPADSSKSFWANAGSVFGNNPVAPYLTFDVYQNTFFGPAYPTNYSQGLIASYIIQTVTLGTDGKVAIDQQSFPGWLFVASLIDPKVDKQTNSHAVYLVGWSSFSTTPFVVVRGEITLNPPSLQLDPVQNTLNIPMYTSCYDQYTETLRPQLNLTDESLVILIPGRCSLFAKILFEPGKRFSQLNVDTYYPIQAFNPNDQYLSSAIFDHESFNIFYTIKTYNTPGATLFSYSVSNWTPNSAFIELDDAESETILVLGNDKIPTPSKYIYVVGSGSSKIQRFEFTANRTFSIGASAIITPDINKISSAYYFYPFLYFITYEPDAKIGRITKPSFCYRWCGDYGYCIQGQCFCQEGYSVDLTDPNTPCKLSALVSSEI